jgi:DNA-binding beta-propeller fold protein YncE
MRALVNVWIWAFAIAVLPGCSRESSERSPLKSQFFTEVQIIGTRGTAPGQFNKPRSLAVDSKDNLFVVDMTARVQKFSPEGIFQKSWQMQQTDKGKPKGMCGDEEGNIIVVEPHYSRINDFTPDGRLVRQWGTYGTNAGQLAMPRSVAADARGRIFISEYGAAERVQVFTHDGNELVQVIGREGSGNGEFNRAEGLGLDAAGRLYVADSCNHRIQVFSPEGQWLRTFGGPGSGLGEMSYPYDVRVDSLSYQFVCEFGNSRIQIFDANERPVEILGGTGSAPGRFNNPWSIALDSMGNLYVADAGNHRVQKFVRKHIHAPLSK